MKPVIISTSFMQENKHEKCSSRYSVITPALAAQVASDAGLELTTLGTGRARKAEYGDFQKTMARYRGPEILPGIFLDVLHINKHLGRGVSEVMLGIYRLVCSNGLVVGHSFYRAGVRHTGNAQADLLDAFKTALLMRDKIGEIILKLQNTSLDAAQIKQFADEAASLVVPTDAKQVAHRLDVVRRAEDAENSAWNVFNRVQESIVQGRNVAYTLESVTDDGQTKVRAMNARAIKPNTQRDADVNGALFDLAVKLAA